VAGRCSPAARSCLREPSSEPSSCPCEPALAPLTELARIVAFGQSTPPAYDQIKLWRDYYAGRVGHDGVAERVWRRAGVRTRHLTVSPMHEDVCRWSTAQRMRRFLDDALPLAKEAVGSALVAAALTPEEVGLLATVSCTGYANPGLDVHLAKDLGMRPAVRRLAIGHMGCYAAIPGLAVATDYVIAQRRPALLVCTELPSLHVQPPPHDTEQAVAHALFADACAALVLAPSQIVGPGLDVIAVETITDVGSTAEMTWDITDHGFRMTLSPRVPTLVARNALTLVDRLLTERGLAPDDVRHWAIHPGGPRIIDKLQEVFSLGDVQVERSRDILSRYGNCSSATILLTLASMRPVPVGDYVLAMAFGPGLTVTGALLQGAAVQGAAGAGLADVEPRLRLGSAVVA
jgi:alkylresorcinol/alkylpyrone synthase